MKNRHIGTIFEFIKEDILISDIKFHFSSRGLMDREDVLEFKSEYDVNPKTMDFVKDTLLPTIRRYIKDPLPSRLCILYGIEDTGEIKPVPQRRLRSENINIIDKEINKELKEENISAIVQAIPFKEDVVLAIFIIPDIKRLEVRVPVSSRMLSAKQEYSA